MLFEDKLGNLLTEFEVERMSENDFMIKKIKSIEDIEEFILRQT